MGVLTIITMIIAYAGMVIIIWGSIWVFGGFLRIEYQRLRRGDVRKKRTMLRQHLGSYLLLGLEFMIAADVIRTVARPDVKNLILLASIVAIRTVISYFLNREIQSSQKCIV